LNSFIIYIYYFYLKIPLYNKTMMIRNITKMGGKISI